MSNRDERHEANSEIRVLRARVRELEATLAEHSGAVGALRESEHKLRTLLENAPDSITVMTPDGTLLYVNRVGVAPPRTIVEPLGRNATDYMPPEEGKRFMDAVKRAVETGQPQTLEVQTVGNSQWETRLVPLRQHGEVTSVMGIGTDVTERRKLEEQLRQAQKMEAVGRLTAGLAHNFNNLLAAIIPSIQLAMRFMPQEGLAHLKDAEHAALRAAELVRELVLFAHPGRGIAKAPVDVARLVRRSVDICRAFFDRSIDIVFASESAPPVLAEAGPLEQVFMNVCLNARDALESVPHAERSIRVDVDAVPRESNGSGPDEWVRVRIADNGPGMSEEVRTHVFEPFFTTKAVGKGSGLGLATAYAIVNNHGGRILCDSAPDMGTTFTILLPALDAPAPALPRAKSVPSGGTETILIVDDEGPVRSAVRSVLEREGYTVLEAADGELGIDLFRREQHRIALTLLDFSMPGVQGEEVLRAILRERPSARVVAFTGYPPDVAPDGLLAVLEKPVEVDELLRVVRELCDTGSVPNGPM